MGRAGNVKNLKPWKPGQCPNPGGRPKGIRAVLQNRYGADGQRILDELGRLAFGRSIHPRIRLQALIALLDRGWGKPIQTVDLYSEPPVPLFALPAGTRVDCGTLPAVLVDNRPPA